MTAAHSPRVLFLLSSLSVGGSEKKTIRIANALANQGWQVSIAHLDGIHDLRPQISVRVEVIFLERSGKFSIGALRRLVAYIRRSHVDVLCCINLYSLIYGFLSKILVFRSFKLIATSNATEFVRRKDELKMFLYAPMLRRANAVVFGSEFQAELWTKNYRLDPARCTYIYNGVDLEYFDVPGSSSDALETRRKLGIPASAFVFGSIGTFRREKQYQMAIRTCIRLRQEKGLDAYCLLVGGGFKEAELKALVAELDCKRYVLLLESVDDVRPYLSAMDVFVLTSISETFSNAALEAMATGKPVVLPRVGGCPEMVAAGENGFIYAAGDELEFAGYLSSLDSDEPLRRRMGEAARSYVERGFRFEFMVDAYADLFKRIA